MPAVVAGAECVVSISLLQCSIFHQVHVADACEANLADHLLLDVSLLRRSMIGRCPRHEVMSAFCYFERVYPEAETFAIGIWHWLVILELSELSGIESNMESKMVGNFCQSFLSWRNKGFCSCPLHCIRTKILECPDVTRVGKQSWLDGKEMKSLSTTGCEILTQDGNHHLWGQESLHWKTLPNLPKQKTASYTFLQYNTAWPKQPVDMKYKRPYLGCQHIKLWLASSLEGASLFLAEMLDWSHAVSSVKTFVHSLCNMDSVSNPR